MKTVLVNPPWFCLQNRDYPLLPLGLASVAGILRKNGHNVVILNGEKILGPQILNPRATTSAAFFHASSQYLEYQDPVHPIWIVLRDAILKESPDIIGLSVWSAAFPAAVNICRAVKARHPRVITVAGGVHPTLDPESVGKLPEIDFVIRGEGEIAACKLWMTLEAGKDVFREGAKIPGVWTKIDGCLHDGGTAPLVENLDSIPFPFYQTIGASETLPHLGIVTARGCPFGCSFCASELLWTRRVRYRSIHSCIEELAHLHSQYGMRSFRINDDSFCLKKDRVLEFCGQLTAKFGRGRLPFSIDANASSLDDGILAALERAGCQGVNIGVESVAPRIRRDFIRKPIDTDHVRRIVSRINDGPMTAGVYFMTGFPEETEEELEQTIQFMIEIEPGNSMWSIVTPYPGTELYRYAAEKGILPRADAAHLMHHSVRTSMAAIKPEAYERALWRILGLVDDLALKDLWKKGRKNFLRNPKYLVRMMKYLKIKLRRKLMK
ncbi:MAG: radical SAM protein [Candidatus Sumerlaeota bacterium]|nr:radical SAM protein [Candidatus Sumerlaeota bacterium]